MTGHQPDKGKSLLRLTLKILGWSFALICILILLGAIAVFVIMEIDANTFCNRPSYHSAECKDIRVLQLYMMIFGACAISLLGLQYLLTKSVGWLRLRAKVSES